MPPRRLCRRPAPREWAVNEVLAHLADAEIALAFRMRRIAAEPNAMLTPYDQDAWARGLRYRTADPQAALGAFSALRRANLGVLGRLTRSQRQQTGRHPEYGRLSIDHLVAHWAEHDLNHARQIRTALQAMAGRR